jgi:hypothetical protein
MRNIASFCFLPRGQCFEYEKSIYGVLQWGRLTEPFSIKGVSKNTSIKTGIFIYFTTSRMKFLRSVLGVAWTNKMKSEDTRERLETENIPTRRNQY